MSLTGQTAHTQLPGTAPLNTDHFCTGFGHGDLHLLGAAAITRRTKFDLHGFLVLLLTLQAVCHRLDGSHPLLPGPEGGTQ